MKVLIPVEVDENEILGAVFDNIYRRSSPWIVEYTFSFREIENKKVPVTYWDINQKVRIKYIGNTDLVKAYGALLRDKLQHCGVPVPMSMDEWDSCVSDYVLQYAVFGGLVYSQKLSTGYPQPVDNSASRACVCVACVRVACATRARAGARQFLGKTVCGFFIQ